MNDKNEQIKFRKNALEEIASPKALDDLIRVTSPKAWIMLISFATIIIGIIFWAIFGTIVTHVHGKGILIAEDASLTSVVTPEQGGYIQSIKVQVGSPVTKDMPIAILTNPNLGNELSASKQYLGKLIKLMSILMQTSKVAIQKHTIDVQAKRKALNNILSIERDKRRHLYDLLKSKQTGFKQGVVGKESLVKTQIDYYVLMQSIAKNENALINLKIDESKFIDNWQERLRNLRLKIDEQTTKLLILQGKTKISNIITSPADGIVTSIRAKVGDYINKGKAIITIVTKESGLEAIVYVDATKGKHIKPGMRAQVIPSTVSKLEYGGILGKVTTVANYPANPDSLQAVLKNQSLVKQFTGKGAVISISIDLVKDKNTFTGYRWTSSNGPQQYITQGTLIEANIVTRKQSPISLFIPTIEKMVH